MFYPSCNTKGARGKQFIHKNQSYKTIRVILIYWNQSAPLHLGVWIGKDPSGWDKNTREVMKRTYANMSRLTKLKYAGLSQETKLHIYSLFVR